MRHLFAYGTLMCDDILATVAGHRLEGRPARLPGYRRRELHGKSYPGIVPDAGANVDGRLYPNLPAAAWPRLDRFEGELYRRRRVVVELTEGRKVPAEVYVIRPRFRRLLTGDGWELKRFLSEGKRRFLGGYRGFRTV